MAKIKENREKLPVDRLVKGLFIDLELPWTKHPFLFSRFKIRSEQDIAAIKQLGLAEITVIPELSDFEMTDRLPSASLEEEQALETLWLDKQEHINRANHYRDRRFLVHQRYHQKASEVRKIAKELKIQPANAIHHADTVIDNLASEFENQGDLLTNLVNLGTGEHNFYNHSINVTILSLLVASTEGLRGDELRQVGIGALLHDIGKIEIPRSLSDFPSKSLI
jgi:HD-GYP domain-containing protein (c-di-GMP phosphodiesterase class II)